MKININSKKGKISKYIYGQFAEHLGRCIYEGLYVGEDSDIPNKNGMRCDVVDALKELEIPVLRWPGGCFADDYHWRDGIGKKEDRPYMVNTNWGGVVENNHFGTHEFFELCEQLETEPYICGNVGSGTVKEMRDCIEYMTFDGDSPLANERRSNGREKPWKLKFFGVGNENWGCGGDMRPLYYCDQYRRYSTFIRNYGEEPIYKIAGGPNRDDTNWMETLMNDLKGKMSGISLHHYTFAGDWDNKGDSVCFGNDEWYKLMANAVEIDEVIGKHIKIMDKYDPEKKTDLIVDEWGTWYDVMPGTNPGFLYQQNTIRDAVSGMLSLHIFHKYNDRIFMANIAQMINVLQAMILTEGENIVLTPTYYLFKMMKNHMEGERIEIEYNSKDYVFEGHIIPKISASATIKNNIVTISMCNTSLEEDEEINLEGINAKSASGELLTAVNMNDYNDFGDTKIKPKELNTEIKDGNIKITVPRMSIVAVNIEI